MRAPETRPRHKQAQRVAFLLLAVAICLSGLELIHSVIQVNGTRGLYDFRGGLFNAGVAILHGHTPYQPGFLAHQAAIMHAGGIAVGETSNKPFSIPVYPAMANVAVVPLSLLPFWLAATIYSLLSVAALLVGLRLLGVRDWRCLALALISWPFMFGLFLGAIGPFLVLGTGIAWRYRDRLWPPALAIATVVGAKVFPWPLGVWLLITRRYKALALTVAAGVVLTFGAWALIGFDGLAQYPKMLSEVSFLQEGRAVSVVAVLLVAGVPAGMASAITMGLTGALLFTAWRIAGGPDGDRRSFALVIIAALTSTPIVWEHYMVLLLVPVALVSPRLSKLWLLPMCTPLVNVLSTALIPQGSQIGPHPAETLRTAVPWLLVEAVVTARVLFPAAALRPSLAKLGLRRLLAGSAAPAVPTWPESGR
jgi:hypothetical protein